MKIEKRFKNLVISLGLIAALTSLAFLLYYHDNEGLGKSFNVMVIFIFIRQVAIYAAPVALLLRILKIIKTNDNLLYVFVGSLNFLTGCLMIGLYYGGSIESGSVREGLLNFLAGAILLADTFVMYSKEDPKSNAS